MRYSCLIILLVLISRAFVGQDLLFEKKCAHISLGGYNLFNNHWNDRLFQKEKMLAEGVPNGLAILGTSRVRKIDQRVLKRTDIMNYGVSGAGMEDILALYYNFVLTREYPDEILIGVEPWMITHNSDKRWKALSDDYGGMKKTLEDTSFTPPLIEKQKELSIKEIYKLQLASIVDSLQTYSLGYNTTFHELNSLLHFKRSKVRDTVKFFTSLLRKTSLYDSLAGNYDIVLTDDGEKLVAETKGYRGRGFKKLDTYQKINVLKLNSALLESNFIMPEFDISSEIITLFNENASYTIFPTGFIEYDKRYESKDSSRILQEAKKTVKNLHHSVKSIKNKKLSSLDTDLFEKFVKRVIADGVKVRFILVPFHPYLYNYFENAKEYAIIGEFELYVRELSEQYGIKLYGSYDPSKNGVLNEDFYDGMHLRQSGLFKIIHE